MNTVRKRDNRDTTTTPTTTTTTTTTTTNNNNNNNNNNNIILTKKEAEKFLKYKEHTTEIQRIRNMKSKVMSLIIGPTGTISSSLGQYLSNVPGNHEIMELRPTAILGTAQTLQEVLM